jgi:hypothetical protein
MSAVLMLVEKVHTNEAGGFGATVAHFLRQLTTSRPVSTSMSMSVNIHNPQLFYPLFRERYEILSSRLALCFVVFYPAPAMRSVDHELAVQLHPC